MSEQGTRRAAVSSALEQAEAELQAAQQELSRWEARVSDLRQQVVQLRAEYQAALQQALAEELRALHERLDGSAADWRVRERRRQQAAGLEAELAAQLAADAGLAAALQAYDDAIAQRDKLNEFPEGIRDALLKLLEEKLAELAERSAGYRALQQQRDGLLTAEGVALQLACVADEGQLWHWITPWPADAGDDIDSDGVRQLMAALSSLGRNAHWTVDDVDTTAWQGRLVITLLANYHGAAEHALHNAAELIQAQLQAESQPLQVTVSRLAGDLWQVRERPAVAEVTAAVSGEDEPPVTQLQSDWFTAADLRSWTRKASKRMGPAQRRMRTLVMRLLARGHINDGGVSLAGLIEGLPVRHAEALRADIAVLQERQLLLAGDSGALTLNRMMLDDYRALILRDPGDVWVGGG